MKRETLDLTIERKIVTNMIISDEFLKSLYPLINLNLFQSGYTKLVVGWVLEYFVEFQQSPKNHIQDIFLQKQRIINSDEELDLVKEFLVRLSDESDELHNVEYAVQQAVGFLKQRSIAAVRDKLSMHLLSGDTAKAEQEIANYKRIEHTVLEGCTVLNEPGDIYEAFLTEDEELFRFPGALGEVAGTFVRGDLVAWMGAMGRGKTWWLWFTAHTAMAMGLKVALFTLEMTRRQMLRRAWTSMTGEPRKAKRVKIPTFIGTSREHYTIDYKEVDKMGVNLSNVAEKQREFKKMFRTGNIKLIALPAYTAKVSDLLMHLDNLEYYDKFVPDVVIVDYADIVCPEKSNTEYRHQLDSIWKGLRQAAQMRNQCWITATQTDRKSISAESLSEEGIAEDIRKLAHVSKMLTINQTPEEYDQQIQRIGQMKEREGRKSTMQAVVAQCLDIGRPYLDSRLKKVTKK